MLSKKVRDSLRLFGGLAALFLFVACGALEREPRNYVQEYPIKKSSLDGVWYYQMTVVEAPYEASWTFIGEQGAFPYVYKMRWDIERDYLYGYLTYEQVKGSDPLHDSYGDDYKGEPIVAFKITSHFDIRRGYNSTTGEEYNYIEENTSDRKWWEREYMRVDWSQNLINNFAFITASLFFNIQPQGGQYYIARPNDFYAPIFLDEDGDGKLDYIEITTKYVYNDEEVVIRNSFMKKKPSTYKPLYYPDRMFEKFGYFRQERSTWDRYRGKTDFLDYLMNRWNIWESDLDECVNRKARYPYKNCKVKKIVYYLSPAYPEKYKDLTFKAVESWNRAFREVMKELKGEEEDVFVLKDNDCNVENVKNYVESHDQYMYIVEKYAGSLDAITTDNLLPICRDLYVESRDKNKDRYRYGADDNYTPDPNRFTFQRPGDLRYSMINYIYDTNSASPWGYGPSSADVETGEIIHGIANIYGAIQDYYRGYLYDYYDLIHGYLSDSDIEESEHIREYFEHTENIKYYKPVPRPFDGEFIQYVTGHLNDLRDKLEELKNMDPKLLHQVASKLKGTKLEKDLINDEILLGFGFNVDAYLNNDVLDSVSPLRQDDYFARMNEIDKYLAYNTLYRPTFYTDYSWNALFNRAEKELQKEGITPTREAVVDWVDKYIYTGVMAHEVGHTLGLRHNFEASFDKENYFQAYWDIINGTNKSGLNDDNEGNPLPDVDMPSGDYTDSDWQAYVDAYRQRKADQEKAGVDLYTFSSIMDYGGQFYHVKEGVGKYDIAAIKFGYGGLVEVYDGAPNEEYSNRINVHYYMGGQFCTKDEDCPGYNYGQRCGKYVQKSGGGAYEWQEVQDGEKGTCSDWDMDMTYRDAISYPHYHFCSDERRDDKPFCNTWDEGYSSYEIVENMIETYEREYIFNNFRRYKYSFPSYYVNRLWRYFSVIGLQLQAMLYQWFYVPGFTSNTGPGGIIDMLNASILGMEFFTDIIATPAYGTYYLDTEKNMYRLCDAYSTDADCNYFGNNLDVLRVPLGFGKFLWTQFEDGYYGEIFRVKRVGTFMDKYMALYSLSTRDWGLPQANDETYPINYYDAFDIDMIKLFGSIIAGDNSYFGPVVKSVDGNTGYLKEIEYKDLWSRTFFGGPASGFGPGSTSGTPEDRYQGMTVIDPETPDVLRVITLVMSLDNFGVWFDNTYKDNLQLYVYNLGQPVSDDLAQLLQTSEVIEYYSPISNKRYIAVQNQQGTSITYKMVQELVDLKQKYEDALNNGDDNLAARYMDSLTTKESFLDVVYFYLKQAGAVF